MAYGSARDVGRWLIELTSPDWGTAFHASHMLWCSLCHQHAYISPAAESALPFLFEVAKEADERLLVELLDIFCGFAVCSEPPGAALPEGDWVKSLRAKLIDEVAWFRSLQLLDSADAAGFVKRILASLVETEKTARPPKSFAELLSRYAKGERDFHEADLDTEPDNNLGGKSLDGVDLSRSYVVANFRNASLRGARFCGANLKTCDFGGADLRDADFTGAALCSANFDGANLERAKFAGANVHSYIFEEGETPLSPRR